MLVFIALLGAVVLIALGVMNLRRWLRADPGDPDRWPYLHMALIDLPLGTCGLIAPLTTVPLMIAVLLVAVVSAGSLVHSARQGPTSWKVHERGEIMT